MTRFGLLPSRMSRPSTSPCCGEMVPDDGGHAGRRRGWTRRRRAARCRRACAAGPRRCPRAPPTAARSRDQALLVGLHADQDDVGIRQPPRSRAWRAAARPHALSATIRSRSGSMPPMGDCPRLIAVTFQPDVGESRCTTTTRRGAVGALADPGVGEHGRHRHARRCPGRPRRSCATLQSKSCGVP